MKRKISPNNAKYHKQEASLLVNTLIIQIMLLKSEQNPEGFCSKIIEGYLGK